MKELITKSESIMVVPRNFLELRNSIIDGTAPEDIMFRFKTKYIQMGVDEAIRECLSEWSIGNENQRKGLKFSTFFFGFIILILGTVFPVSRTKNKKSGSQEELGLVSSGPKSGNSLLNPKIKVVVPHLLPDQLNFCGELVPIEDRKISRKFKVALSQTRFTRKESQNLRRRVNKWFPVIAPILKKYQIPDDFKYIPLVETGFANTVSHRGAGGFWQLMEGTARQYGLKVTDSTDERTDVRRCTIAACKYIRDLHRELGSWTLTAAAYNMGPGGLINKLDDQNIRDYYKLQLNSETSKYVFKTLVFKQMLSPRKKKNDPYSG
jgi:hypothetical protein